MRHSLLSFSSSSAAMRCRSSSLSARAYGSSAASRFCSASRVHASNSALVIIVCLQHPIRNCWFRRIFKIYSLFPIFLVLLLLQNLSRAERNRRNHKWQVSENVETVICSSSRWATRPTDGGAIRSRKRSSRPQVSHRSRRKSGYRSRQCCSK